MKEIEIKIKLENPKVLMQKVRWLGGVFLKNESGKEKDVYYDNLKRDFLKHGRNIRVRESKQGTILTFKGPRKKHDFLLNREEIEVFVSDKKLFHEILSHIGFTPAFFKEKINNKFRFAGSVLEFHQVPFLGNFLEIEGSPNQIDSIIKKLGYKLSQGINKGYMGLFNEYKKIHKIPEKIQLSFEAEQKYGNIPGSGLR